MPHLRQSLTRLLVKAELEKRMEGAKHHAVGNEPI